MARKKNTRKPGSARTLREKAENLLRTRPADTPMLPTRDVQSLVCELSARLAALVAQNEELRLSQAELAETRDRYAELYDFAPVGYVILDRGGKIHDANLTVAAMLGVDRREMTGKNFQKYLPRGSRDDFHQHLRGAGSAGRKRTCEIDIRRSEGTMLTMRLESVKFRAGGHYRLRTALVDITEKKHAENSLRQLNITLEQQAHTDELTGLPNRGFFMTIYRQKFGHIKRHFRNLALFMLDLNNFKVINDKYGHVEGDYVLRQMAERLQKACRSGDFLARFGGDEFVLLVEDYKEIHDLVRIAEKIDASVNIPIKHGGRTYRISASVGIAILDNTNISMDTLLTSADDAMYKAKRGGRLYCLAGTPTMRSI